MKNHLLYFILELKKMRFKYKVIIVRARGTIILLSLLLTCFGLASPVIFRGWLPPNKVNLPLWILFLSATVGFLLGKYAHETYRYLISRMLGVRAYFIFFPFPRTYFLDSLSKWQAISITLAPFADLTLLGLIGLAFGTWLFIPSVVTFITVNFILSAHDLIESYYLFRMVGAEEIVHKRPDGFEIWG